MKGAKLSLLAVAILATLAFGSKAYATSDYDFMIAPACDPVDCDSWDTIWNFKVDTLKPINWIQFRVALPNTIEVSGINPVHNEAVWGFSGFGSINWHTTDLFTANGYEYAAAGGETLTYGTHNTVVAHLTMNGNKPTGSAQPVVFDIQSYGPLNGNGPETPVASATYEWYQNFWWASVNGEWKKVPNAGARVDPEDSSWFPQGVPQDAGQWDATAPIPEPLTMLGVFGSVAGIGAYLRRRSANQVA